MFNQVYFIRTERIYRFVMRWDKRLKETGSVLWHHGPPHRTVSEESLLAEQVHRSTALYSSSYFTSKTQIACLQASVGRDIIFKDHDSRKLSRFEEDQTNLDRICFSDEATFHVYGTVNKHSCPVPMGKWKYSWCYWTWAWFTEGQCIVRFGEKMLLVLSFMKNLRRWWHFSGCDGEHWFALCPSVLELISSVVFMPFRIGSFLVVG